MNQTGNVTRHANGSIDFDFYRERAKALRSQALRDAQTLRWGIAILAIVGLTVPLAFAPNQGVRFVAQAVAPGPSAPLSCTRSGSSGFPSTRC
jgi:hypothetical protein